MKTFASAALIAAFVGYLGSGAKASIDQAEKLAERQAQIEKAGVTTYYKQ